MRSVEVVAGTIRGQRPRPLHPIALGSLSSVEARTRGDDAYPRSVVDEVSK